MMMVFRNTQEAMAFGRKASETQLRKIRKAKDIYQFAFDHRMSGPPKTLEEFDRLIILSTNIQFCNECLAEAQEEA